MIEPDYYNQDGLSPIAAMKMGLISREEYIGFLKGNIIKYIIRAGKKDDAVKDLLKARQYINFFLELYAMPIDEVDLLITDKEDTGILLDDLENNHKLLAELIEKEMKL